jgi:uncharacterized phage-associated protein
MGNEVPERQYDPNTPYFIAPLVGFRSRKAAQICAFFAVKSKGIIEKLKLIKLVYFSERKTLADYHRPMLFDELFSLPHGPICSSTLNGIDGEIHGHLWDDFLARNGNAIVAMKNFNRDDLDEISDDEIATLEKIWKDLGHMTASQLRNYSHENCPEYTETEGRIPIAYREVLEALGVSEPEAESVEREIAMIRREESVLGV